MSERTRFTVWTTAAWIAAELVTIVLGSVLSAAFGPWLWVPAIAGFVLLGVATVSLLKRA